MGNTGAHADISAAFDWTALVLCFCALALLSLQRAPGTRFTPTRDFPESGTATVSATQSSNIAIPEPDDARLRLAQSLSHELRTPLNAVIGFSDLMSHQLHGNLGHPKYNEYCAHISASSHTLLRAVDDILALNACRADDIRKRVPLPLACALQTVWEKNHTAPTLPEDQPLNLRIIDEQNRLVIADPEILSHALKNILETLSRQSEPGATVSAVIENADEKTRICCSIDVDTTKIVETAPLTIMTGNHPLSQRVSRDTLTEAAAEALVKSMDGELTISQPAGTGRLEMICELPAPRIGNTPRPHHRLAA